MGSASSDQSPWFATDTITAGEARFAVSALLGHHPESTIAAEAGVVPANPDPFRLTSVGTASAPAWSVGPGQAVVQRTVGGSYVGTWDQPKTITVDLPLPSSGQTRRDLVVCDVVDPEADSAVTSQPATAFRVRTVTGTAASSPSRPQVPTGTVPLWEYTVAANGALSGVNTMRPWTRAVGGLRFVEPGDTRAGSHIGDLRIFATGQIDTWLVVGGTAQWVTIVAAPAWTPFTPVLVGSASGAEFGFGTGGSRIGRYKRVGNDLSVSYAFRWGSRPWSTPAGPAITYLPNGWVGVARDQWFPCQIWVRDDISGVTLDFVGMALVQAGSNIVRPYFPRSNGSGGFATGVLPYHAAGYGGTGPGRSVPYIAGGYAQGGTVHIGPTTIEVAA